MEACVITGPWGEVAVWMVVAVSAGAGAWLAVRAGCTALRELGLITSVWAWFNR